MSRLVSKRLLSSHGKVQGLWGSTFPFPRYHTFPSVETTICSDNVGTGSSVQSFLKVVTGSGFASPKCMQGKIFRAFSSGPSSFDHHDEPRTTKTVFEGMEGKQSHIDTKFLRSMSHGGWSLLTNDSKASGWLPLMNRHLGAEASCLRYSSLPKMMKFEMSTLSGNNSQYSQHGSNVDHKVQRGLVDSPGRLEMCVRYLNTALLFPSAIIYNKITSTFILNLSLFGHINQGIKEILADYVHQEMTRDFILVCLKLFLLIAMKDVFLSVVF